MPLAGRSQREASGQQLAFEGFDVQAMTPAAAPDPGGCAEAEPRVPTPTTELAGVLWRHPEANRESRLGGVVVGYRFARGQRRTIGLSVGPQGLSVRAPRWTPLGEVERFLQSRAAWVLEKLHQVQRQVRQSPLPQRWSDGSRLDYLGRGLTLRLDPTHRLAGTGGALRGDELLVGLAHDVPEARLREAVQAWLRREAERVFRERLDHFAPRLGVQYTRLRLSSATTRWGSASVDGSIRLNWRLVHLSLEMIDYVVAHELSHLREMNHSADFWGVVGSVLPDYRERRQALRQVRLG
jgi:predicted metal-dependent hydrolase